MVSVVRDDGYTTLVLADGMGSGVKANILATLTSTILSTMVSENIPLDDCVETINRAPCRCARSEASHTPPFQ